MIHPRHIVSLLLGVLLSLTAATAFAEPTTPDVPKTAFAQGAMDGDQARVETRLLVEAARVKPGQKVRVGVLYTLDPGWHIYWRNTGEAGLSTDTSFASKQATFGALQWPAPSVFKDNGGTTDTFGYADQVLFFTDATVAPDAHGELALSAKVDYLACKKSCIPGNATLTRSIPIAASTQPASDKIRKLFDAAALEVPRTARQLGVGVKTVYSQKSIRPGDKFRAAIALDYCALSLAKDCDGFTVAYDVKKYAFIPDRTAQAKVHVVDVRAYPGVDRGQILDLVGEATGQKPRQDERLSGVIHLESASGSMESLLVDQPFPRAPKGAQVAAVKSPLLRAAPAAADSAAKKSDAKAAAAAKQVDDTPAKKPAGESMSLWKALLLAFLGGMVLNLMPCVFPVLAIKVSSFAQVVHETKAGILSHGLAYTAGIVGSLVSLAAVVVGLRAAGTHVGWGFQFQEPGFIVALAAIVVLFALNLFGVFELSVAPNELANKTRQATGMRRSFGEGVLAVILATPCSAPFLGTAVGFALTSNAVTIFAIFATLGLGLAAPFVVLSLSPGWAKVLPKPGAWMSLLKEVLGFALLGTAIWLFWILGQMTGVAGIVQTLIFLGALALAAWFFGKIQYRFEGVKKWGLTLLAAAVVTGVGWRVLELAPAHQHSSAEAAGGEIQWKPWSDAAVQRQLAKGRTVFVDFGADWCISCKVNERTVLYSDAVEDAFRKGNVATLKGDWTNPDERIRKKLAAFGRGGVPMYLVYHPDHPHKPQLLPEVLTTQIVLDALNGR